MNEPPPEAAFYVVATPGHLGRKHKIIVFLSIITQPSGCTAPGRVCPRCVHRAGDRTRARRTLSGVYAVVWGPVLTVDGVLFRLLLGIAIVWIGVAATASGVKSVKEWREILTAESASIADAIATTGLTRIRGRVRPARPNSTLVSPLRGTECVAYEYDISTVVQDTGRSSIDSDTECSPFLLSDGTGTVLVTPDEGSLALDTTTSRPTSKPEIADRAAGDRLDWDPSAYTSDVGELTVPIELSEGTISVGERVTVVGNVTPVLEETTTDTDADAVVTPEADHLSVMNDDPRNAALRKAARGGFLLILGALFNAFAMLVLTTAVSEMV